MHGSFHYDIQARCRVEDAVALMSDVPRLTSRHPLAVSTRELPPGDGVLRSTAVTSRLRLGPFRWHVTYRADLLAVEPNRVVTVAHQWPRTTLVNEAHFTAERDRMTSISVNISYTSPRGLFAFGFAQAKLAHGRLALGIKELLEARS